MAVGTEVGKIFYKLDLDNNDFKRGVSDSSSMASKMGNTIESAGKKAALAFTAIGAAAVAFGVVSVKAYQESQNIAAQTNAVLKSTGDVSGLTATQVHKLAAALQQTTTYDDETVQSVENLLLTFTSLSGDIMPQATRTVLDMATALGEDTKDASIQLGKALQDPVLGITALRRVGVNFSEDQKNVIAKLVETGQKAKAQQLILKELNTEFGGSASAAAGTFAGKLQQLKNNFNDVEEGVGHFIIVAIGPLVDGLARVVKAMEDAGGPLLYLKQLFEQNQAVFSAIGGILVALLIPAIISMGVALWTAMAPLLPFIAAGALLGLMVNNIAQSMGGWHNLLTSVHATLSKLWGILSTALTPSMEALGHTIRDQLWPQIQRLWQTVEPGLTNVLKVLGALLGVFLVGAIYLFVNALNIYLTIAGYVWAATSNVIQWFINLWHTGAAVFSLLGDSAKLMWASFKTVLGGIGGLVSGALGAAARAVENWFGTFYSSGVRLIQSLAKGIADGVGAAVGAVKGVLSKVRNMLPFSDAKEGPLSDLTLSGQRFSETFAKGITNGAGAVHQAATAALTGLGGNPGGVSVNGSQGGGTMVENNIGNIHINSGVDGSNWLDKLTRQDQLISMGLSG